MLPLLANTPRCGLGGLRAAGSGERTGSEGESAEEEEPTGSEGESVEGEEPTGAEGESVEGEEPTGSEGDPETQERLAAPDSELALAQRPANLKLLAE
jgi:hypothetical protein